MTWTNRDILGWWSHQSCFITLHRQVSSAFTRDLTTWGRSVLPRWTMSCTLYSINTSHVVMMQSRCALHHLTSYQPCVPFQARLCLSLHSVCFLKAIFVWLSAWYIFYCLVWSVHTDTCSLPSSENAKGNHYVDSHMEIKILLLTPKPSGECVYYSQRSR